MLILYFIGEPFPEVEWAPAEAMGGIEGRWHGSWGLLQLHGRIGRGMLSYRVWLFYLLEQCAKKESSPSVTSIKCKWSQPSRESLRRVEYEEGRNIVFNHSQKVKRVKLADSNISHGIQPLSQDETRHLYDKLSTCTSHDNKPLKPGILSVVRGHAQNFIPQTVELNLPDPLTALYSAENRELTPQQIQEKADETFSNISITNEQVKLSLIIVWLNTLYE